MYSVRILRRAIKDIADLPKEYAHLIGERTMERLTVADLTIDEFKALVREVIVQTLSEIFGDPDEGLELNEDFQLELQHSLDTVKAGGKTIPVNEVAERLELRW